MSIRELRFAGYTFFASPGGTVIRRERIDLAREDDYGTDPVFDESGAPTGLVKLVPSGRVVTFEEAREVLSR